MGRRHSKAARWPCCCGKELQKGSWWLTVSGYTVTHGSEVVAAGVTDHTAGTVRKKRKTSAGVQLAFLFYSVCGPRPTNGVTHIQVGAPSSAHSLWKDPHKHASVSDKLTILEVNHHNDTQAHHTVMVMFHLGS